MKPIHLHSAVRHPMRALRAWRWWPALLAEAALVAVLAACGGGGGGGEGGDGEGTAGGGAAGGGEPPSAPPPACCTAAGPAEALPAPRRSARLFVSGHSLVDNPLPDDLVRIANSLGGTSEYNEQIILGSPLRVRTRGSDPASGWSGYTQGKNREGQNMDVLAELARPRTVGGTYDVLILTERNDLVGALLWEDTVRYARHFHDRAAAARPGVTSYLYQSWLGLRDKGAPADWIAYERAASQAWGCIATRINQSLVAEGRGERMVSLRAGSALAELVERAVQGRVEGLGGGSVRETVDRIILDDVHPTRLGRYYLALVSYATVYRQSPVGAWRPPEVSAAQAGALQTLAWAFVSAHERDPMPSLAQCTALMRDAFCTAYGTYRGNPQEGTGCQARFSAAGQPFAFDAAADRGYWLAAP